MPYIATHSGARGGRWSGHGCLALPDLTAGEPFQYWPFLTLPTTADPGATSAFLPTMAPGSSVRPGADRRIVADGDRTDVDDVAVDPVPGQVDLGFDGAAVAERQHPGHRRRGCRSTPLPTLAPSAAGVVDDPWRAGQVLRAAGLAQAFGHPHPQVHRTAARVRAGLQIADQDARAEHADAHATERGDEKQEAAEDPPPVIGTTQSTSDNPETTLLAMASQITHCSPVSVASGTVSAVWTTCVRRDIGATTRVSTAGSIELVEVFGQRTEARMVVQVGDGHLRIALPQRSDELCRRERSAAERVEVGVRPVDLRGEDVAPQPRQPAERAAEVRTVVALGVAHRPRQRVAVDLARGASRQFVDDHETGHERRG